MWFAFGKVGDPMALVGPTLEDIASMMEAPSEQELFQRLEQSVRQLGFECFLLGVEVRRPLVTPVHYVTTDYPERWRTLYEQRGYMAKDPTVRFCQEHTSPLHWTESLYTDSRELWEEAGAFGIRHGMSIPVHERSGVKSMVSLTRDQPIDRDVRELESMMAGARVLATCTHVAATRLMVPRMLETVDPVLTPREAECLNWAARGKTAAEISMILRISEPTAVFHLNNVVKKFRVSSRMQAIAVGVSLGLVH